MDHDLEGQTQALLEEANGYVMHPEKLHDQIAQDLSQECASHDPSHVLRCPYPQPFSYRMTRYQGFCRYPERARNFIKAEQAQRGETVSFLPTILDIEPASRCNFRCVMCQVSDWEHGKRAKDMSFGECRTFLDQQHGLTEVKLQGIGEPLMNRHFFDMVDYCAKRFLWIRTTVNGSLLHVKENHKRLVDRGVNEIQTSFDGATKDVFEKIRVNSNFEQVVNNLTMLNDYANRQGRLVTRMWVLLQDTNKHQIFDFVTLAKSMGFRRLTFSLSLSNWGQQAWDQRIRRLQTRDMVPYETLRKLAQLSDPQDLEITFWNLAQKYSTRSPQTLCPWPFRRAFISSDMRVVPCCMIGHPGVSDLGDATTFASVWNGEAYRSFRRSHLQGRPPAFCRNCYEKDVTGADISQ